MRNPYFEVTPSGLVTGIITEEGVMGPGEVGRRMEFMRGYVEALRG